MKKNLLPKKGVSCVFAALLRMTTAILLLLLLTMFSSTAFAKIRYASFDAWTGDTGDAWNHASGDLQAMIDNINPGDQVWVRRGTFEPLNYYTPFRMKSGVSIYGGFEGKEKELWERDLRNPENKTIIKVGYQFAFKNENVIRSLLDGFTVTGALDTGITNSNSSVTIANCIISGNGRGYWNSGGGINNKTSTLWLVNCVVSGNGADYGADIYGDKESKLSIYNCTISGNWAGGSGSAIYSSSCMIIRNTIVYGNDAGRVAMGRVNASEHDIQFSLIKGLTSTANGNISGNVNPLFVTQAVPTSEHTNEGDYRLKHCSPVRNMGSNEAYDQVRKETTFSALTDVSGVPRRVGKSVDMGAYKEVVGNAPKISNVIFSSNTARRGGGMSVESGTAFVSNTNFTNNNVYDVGRGIFLNAGSSTVLDNCVVHDNYAVGNGGGISSYIATLTLTNSVVSNNEGEKGGGMFVYYSTANIFNSTVIKNKDRDGDNVGGIFALNTAFKAQNSIFWGNTNYVGVGYEILVEWEPNKSGSDDVTYSVVRGSYAGEGNLSSDPAFVNVSNLAGPDGIWRTGDDGLRIHCDSPAAEAGSGDLPTLDILGILRTNRMDLGAYEATVGGIVSANATVTGEQAPGSTVTYADCVNQIVTIDGGGSYNVRGEIMAKVWVDANQPVQYVKRHYQITPVENSKTATAKLTLYFTQQDFTDFNNQIPAPESKLPLNAEDVENYKTYLRVEKRDGAGDENGTPGSYSGTLLTINPSDYNGKVEWNAVASRWEVSFEITGFSGFFIKTKDSALPLNLISFTARKSEENNLLQWSTASEVNTDNFGVQSSMDAKIFSKITIIKAAGSGNHQYTYSDTVLGDGRVYYRLKMNDLDGTFAYSKIISLASENSGAAVVYPNPAGNMFMSG